MSYGDIVVYSAVDEKHGNLRFPNRVFRRDFLEIESILPTRVHQCDFHGWTKQEASDPRAAMKKLAHAVVSYLTKVGKWRLRGNGTQAGV
jgi:hypothetical protein